MIKNLTTNQTIQENLRQESLAMTVSNKVFKPPTKLSCTLKILTCTQNQTKILITKYKIWVRQRLCIMSVLLYCYRRMPFEAKIWVLSAIQSKEDEEMIVTQATSFVAATMVGLWSWLEPNFSAFLLLHKHEAWGISMVGQ